MRHLISCSVLLLAACNLAMPFEAAAIPLSDMFVPGASLTQGDKVFSHFSADLAPDPLPTFIEGNTIGGDHGFQISGTVIDGVGEVFTSVLSFKVTVLDPGYDIASFTSALNVGGTSTGTVSLQSSFFADAGHTIGLGSLNTIWSSSPTGSLTLSSAVPELFVRMTFVETGPLDGPFTVQASFGQTPVSTAVPEPSSVLLFGIGLAGLMALRSRQSGRWAVEV